MDSPAALRLSLIPAEATAIQEELSLDFFWTDRMIFFHACHLNLGTGWGTTQAIQEQAALSSLMLFGSGWAV